MRTVILNEEAVNVAKAGIESDTNTNQEQRYSFNEKKLNRFTLENKRLELENKQFDKNGQDRNRYAPCIFLFVLGYIMLATILMCLNNHLGIHIDNHVMMTFLGTTVVNTIGLLMGVIRYLFPAIK